MDPTTASYYRAILYSDSQDTRPLPKTLLRLHEWAFKRCQAMGISSVIPKQMALNVALTWLSATDEGLEFSQSVPALEGLFTAIEETPAGETLVEWDEVAAGTAVVANADGVTHKGEYMGRSASWVHVKVAGEKKSFRHHQVQLAGA